MSNLKKSSAEEVEQLRANTFRLNSLVQELRLEISYYQGETKRLEWEKNTLKQDVSRMSTLFKGWLSELQQNVQNNRNIIEDPEYLKALVKYPAKSISDMMQLSDDLLVVSTCQAPFFIEYVNKGWSSFCGWDSEEVLGLTCAFLQGEGTDLNAAAAFTKDFREIGYGVVRIHNYKKNGEMFAVTLTMYPIFDSMTATGVDSDTPILTHFATVLNDIKPVSSSNQATSSSSSSNPVNILSTSKISLTTSASAQEGNTTSETNSNTNNSDGYSHSHPSSSFDSSLSNTSSGVESIDNEESVGQASSHHMDKKRKDGNRHNHINLSAAASSRANRTSPYDADKHHSKHSTQPTDADMIALQDSMDHDPSIILSSSSTRSNDHNRHLFTNSKHHQHQVTSSSTASSAIRPTTSSSTCSGNASSKDAKSYDADASMNSSEFPHGDTTSSSTSLASSDLDGSSSTVNSMYDGSGINSTNSETMGDHNNSDSSSTSPALGGMTSGDGSSSNGVGDNSSVSSVTSSHLSTVSSLLPYTFVTGIDAGDRRAGCIRFDASCEMSPENFFKAARTVRLSDLLRLMISCQNALLVCDRFGRILHCNKGFVSLFEYVLSDMEGHTLHFLYRQPSDIVLFEQCRMLNTRGESTDVTLQGFRKCGSTVYCRVISVPIRGGYRSNDITHYCSYFYPLMTVNEPNKKSMCEEATVQQNFNTTAAAAMNTTSSYMKPKKNEIPIKPTTSSNRHHLSSSDAPPSSSSYVQASGTTATATAAAASGYNNIISHHNIPHCDNLHGILQRINSAPPLSIIQPSSSGDDIINTSSPSSSSSSSKHHIRAPSSNGSGKSSGNSRMSNNSISTASSSYPEQSTSSLTTSSVDIISPSNDRQHDHHNQHQHTSSTYHNAMFPELTAASLAQQSSNMMSNNDIIPSLYSHHQLYSHHNHHNHNNMSSSSSSSQPHDMYHHVNPPIYPYNHRINTQPSYNTSSSYTTPSASSYPSTLAYARNTNIYNFTGASASSNPIPISSSSSSQPSSYQPTSSYQPSSSYDHHHMMISNDNSPQSTSGLISVGGFIGGIVDSEQDHYHHSDHYHHCEDEEESIIYTDDDDDDDDHSDDDDDLAGSSDANS